MHWGGKTGPQSPGLGCEFVSFTGTPGILLGRLFCIRKGGTATAGIPDRVSHPALRVYPVPPLGRVD